jgi:hypothetical protein
VARLAKDLDLEEATVRLKLRANKIARPGKAYTWPSKDAYEKVLKKLKGKAATASAEKAEAAA